jgi:hypothetical protein
MKDVATVKRGRNIFFIPTLLDQFVFYVLCIERISIQWRLSIGLARRRW